MRKIQKMDESKILIVPSESAPVMVMSMGFDNRQ
jgi:hypothetical protein